MEWGQEMGVDVRGFAAGDANGDVCERGCETCKAGGNVMAAHEATDQA